jgi:FkbM family methyltransferase
MTRKPLGLLIEPNEQCFDGLRQRFKDYDDIEMREMAVSDYTGTATFYENPTSSVTSSLSPRNYDSSGSHVRVKKTVRVATLDDEVAKLGWQKISMIKIDAEGEDFYCLRGARQLFMDKAVDFVQFEGAGWPGVTIAAAYYFLLDLGYRVFQLHPSGLREVDIEYFGDCGSANWLALHDKSPDVGLKISRR